MTRTHCHNVFITNPSSDSSLHCPVLGVIHTLSIRMLTDSRLHSVVNLQAHADAGVVSKTACRHAEGGTSRVSCQH
jgi:hypothetical protein